MDLTDRWNRTWASLDRPPPPGLIDGVISAYSEPHRAYHTPHFREALEHRARVNIRAARRRL
jgi:predicted metal-dependent HD superfamily phosphohydrolase